MINWKHNHSLLKHNTFGIDVTASTFVTYQSVDDLQDVVRTLRTMPRTQLLHIGCGSNLLFTRNFNGVIMHSAISDITTSEQTDSVVVRAGAAVLWDDLVDLCVKRGYYGIENLSFIPGEVGAAAVQNIGAYGAEAADVIESVETVSLIDGAIRTFTAAECGYGYRKSVFKTDLKGQYAVTHVNLRLSKQFVPNLSYSGLLQSLAQGGATASSVTAAQVRQAVIDIRRAKLPDPRYIGNAGSFFVNPVVTQEKWEALKADYPLMPHYQASTGFVKIPAGWLIEQCGWKGKSLGRAGVFPKQALVLVNSGGASGEEILNLCRAIQADVKAKFNIEITPEVNII